MPGFLKAFLRFLTALGWSFKKSSRVNLSAITLPSARAWSSCSLVRPPALATALAASSANSAPSITLQSHRVIGDRIMLTSATMSVVRGPLDLGPSVFLCFAFQGGAEQL